MTTGIEINLSLKRFIIITNTTFMEIYIIRRLRLAILSRVGYKFFLAFYFKIKILVLLFLLLL